MAEVDHTYFPQERALAKPVAHDEVVVEPFFNGLRMGSRESVVDQAVRNSRSRCSHRFRLLRFSTEINSDAYQDLYWTFLNSKEFILNH